MAIVCLHVCVRTRACWSVGECVYGCVRANVYTPHASHMLKGAHIFAGTSRT